MNTGDIQVVAVVQARAGEEAAFAAAIKACVAPSRNEDGCLLYMPYQDQAQPGRFVFIERWTSRAALDAHTCQPHFQTMIATLTPLMAKPFDVMSLAPLPLA